MKGGPAEVSAENLEDFLIYDDLFLDYFNAFMSLPAFPQTLQYNRLTGTFQIVDLGSEDSLVECSTPPYGATDEERERVMQWAREERLHLFLRTEIFRELKLCKLLLRPLAEERNLDSQGTLVRGYSRQTETYASSLSNSGDNSDVDDDDDDDDDDNDDDDDDDNGDLKYDDDDFDMKGLDFEAYNANGEAYDGFERPGSRALSLPAKLGLMRSGSYQSYKEKMVRKRYSRRNSKQKSQVSREVTFASNTDTQPSKPAIVSGDVAKTGKKGSVQFSAAAIDKSRIASAPLNYADYLRLPLYSDFDAIYSDLAVMDRRPLLTFNAAREQTLSDEEVRSMEGRQHISFQRMKELLLGTRLGMSDFIKFLKPTVGIHLVNFWLDCEYYKDNVYTTKRSSESDEMRNKLFRDIQDKYKLRLTEEAKRQIRLASSDPDHANSLFLRTQYDVLRRLRSYWVPRYLIHKEREISGQTLADLHAMSQRRVMDGLRSGMSSVTGIFPSLSLVNSMPVRPDEALNMARVSTWDEVKAGGRRLDDRIKSAKLLSIAQHQAPPCTPSRTFYDKLYAAMSVDKISGGPFQTYLSSHGDSHALYALQFFQDVEEYGRREERTADRLLRLSHAWAIANRYLVPGARNHIGVDRKIGDLITNQLRKAKDLVSVSVFAKAQDFCVSRMEQVWLRFLKEDVKKFMESSISHRDAKSPPHTAEEIEVIIVGDRIVVKRHSSEKTMTVASRRRSWDLLTDEEKAERKRIAAERRKVMEKERRKAIRAAQKRLKEMQNAKKKKSTGLIEVKSESPDGSTGLDLASTQRDTHKSLDGDLAAMDDVQDDTKPPELKEMNNNKAVMALFKKFLGDSEGKDAMNLLSCYQECMAYIAMPGGDKQKVHKKDVQATYIYKTFLDKNSRRHIEMSERVMNKVAHDKERPKTSTVKDMQHFAYTRLSDLFHKFWMYQSEEMGVDMNALRHMSEKELMLRSDPASDNVGKIQPKKGKKASGKAQPTKDDKVEFLMALEGSMMGPLSLQMFYFYKYLVKYGQEDNQPNLDKDLFFYVEVQKFKELSQGNADEDLLRRKVQCVSNTFLESVYPPALQITVPNELHQRILRLVQRYIGGKEVAATLFDEAQYVCFKEMLPYWAGFLRQWETPADQKLRPVTQYQKMLQKRLDMFHNMPMPNTEFRLPSIPNQSQVSALTFTLSDGIKWKDRSDSPTQDDQRSVGSKHRTGALGKEFTNLSSIPEPGNLPQASRKNSMVSVNG